jgi:hypothetical protein
MANLSRRAFFPSRTYYGDLIVRPLPAAEAFDYGACYGATVMQSSPLLPNPGAGPLPFRLIEVSLTLAWVVLKRHLADRRSSC